MELVFKLWKSHGQVDASRSGKPYRILCEVYAKLLGLLVQHWILVVTSWAYVNRSWFKAAQTIRQHITPLGLHLADLEQAVPVLQTIARWADYEGLDVVDYEILPYLNWFDSSFLEVVQQYSKQAGQEVVALADGAAVLRLGRSDYQFVRTTSVISKGIIVS